MNKDKRGQLTLFIIIAIVIVVAIVLVIFLQRGLPGAMNDADVAKVRGYLGDCFELKTKEGIISLGRQAGYYSLDGIESINFLDEQTAYYWKDNQSSIPDTDIVASELNRYLNEKSYECFKSEELVGFDFEGECSAAASISENVNVLFNCPVTVSKRGASSVLGSFDVSVGAPVSKLLNVSNQVVEEYTKRPGYLCVTCFDEIALANNVTITTVPVTKETFELGHIWFLITDKNIKFDDKNITWRFVTSM